MALGKYFEDNQEIMDERLRDADKTGKYAEPVVTFHRSAEYKTTYYEVVPRKMCIKDNTENFCSIRNTNKTYVVRRIGRLAKLDRLNEEMLKLNAQLSSGKRPAWIIQKSSITFTDLIDLLHSCGIRTFIN